jgi:two-component system, cell cycle response regulator
MIRILVVDDSASVRQLLAQRLTERGYAVTLAPEPLVAAEMALREPPDILVTDMWMPGVSGVQLCRLLRAEPRTAHVPVVLITAESERRSRFWARTAGAAAYVAKDDLPALYATLERLGASISPRAPGSPHPGSRIPVQHRLFQRLDAALFESVIAGEIRSLASDKGEADGVFRGLADLASDVASYRWLALEVRSPSRLFVHGGNRDCYVVVDEARAALGLAPEVELTLVRDDRVLVGTPSAALVADVRAAGAVIGRLALGPSSRGASRDDKELVSIFAAQLGGPLRIVELVEQTQRLAMSDPLTGLLNRRAFTDMLTRSLAALERHGDAISMMLLDVDHFKLVNDGHGHEAGDAVLVAVAKLLRDVARRTDFVARWGGEEFVVGLARTGSPGALAPAERIRAAVAGHRFGLPGGADLGATVSIGVASAVKGEGADALVARADRAMYLAKSRGRNRCEVDGSSE